MWFDTILCSQLSFELSSFFEGISKNKYELGKVSHYLKLTRQDGDEYYRKVNKSATKSFLPNFGLNAGENGRRGLKMGLQAVEIEPKFNFSRRRRLIFISFPLRCRFFSTNLPPLD